VGSKRHLDGEPGMKRSSSFAGMVVSNVGEAVVDAGSVRGGSRGKNVPDGSKVRFSSASADPYSESFPFRLSSLLCVGIILCVRTLLYVRTFLCVGTFSCVHTFLCVHDLLMCPNPLVCP
jgi:hypothetical protein